MDGMVTQYKLIMMTFMVSFISANIMSYILPIFSGLVIWHNLRIQVEKHYNGSLKQYMKATFAPFKKADIDIPPIDKDTLSGTISPETAEHIKNEMNQVNQVNQVNQMNEVNEGNEGNQMDAVNQVNQILDRLECVHAENWKCLRSV